MSIHSPAPNWFHAPTGAERLWVGLALAWCVVMSIAMPYWHFKGKQNSTGEAYRVTPQAFMERTEAFVQANKVGEDNYVPVVEPAPGSDVYLVAMMWRWYPVLKLKAGQTYRVHVSSMDLQHGLSILPINVNFQVLPGYDHVITMTPKEKGTYDVVCNEFCGIGHHQMTGKILVE
jgi:cytochrome c oxidase subunit 2